MKKQFWIILFFIVLLQQSCFVVNKNTYWSGETVDNDKNRVNFLDSTKPSIRIALLKEQKRVILPFFFIYRDKGDYGIEFNFNTEFKSYKKIDSISYRIYTVHDSLFLNGNLKNTAQAGTFKCDANQHPVLPRKIFFRSCWASSSTEYKFKLDINDKEDIKINFIFYISAENNQQIIYKESSYKLIRRREGTHSFL